MRQKNVVIVHRGEERISIVRIGLLCGQSNKDPAPQASILAKRHRL